MPQTSQLTMIFHVIQGSVEGHTTEVEREYSRAPCGIQTHDLVRILLARDMLYHISATAAYIENTF